MTLEATIETLWRAKFEQCELLSLGARGYRLRYWRKKLLVVDEEIFDRVQAWERGLEVKAEWPRIVERATRGRSQS